MLWQNELFLTALHTEHDGIQETFVGDRNLGRWYRAKAIVVYIAGHGRVHVRIV